MPGNQLTEFTILTYKMPITFVINNNPVKSEQGSITTDIRRHRKLLLLLTTVLKILLCNGTLQNFFLIDIYEYVVFKQTTKN